MIALNIGIFILKVWYGNHPFYVWNTWRSSLHIPRDPKQQSGETWRAERRQEDAPRLPRPQSPWRLCFQLGHRNRLAWMQTRSLSACVSVFRSGYRSMSPYCCWDRGCSFGRGRCIASLSPWLFTLYSGKCRFHVLITLYHPFWQSRPVTFNAKISEAIACVASG